MSDTVKLIIDIPKEDFEWIQTHRSVTDYQITQMLYKRVMNGTPIENAKSEWQKDHEILKAYSDGANDVLDKIREEIEQTTSRYTISRERGCIGQVEWSDRLIKESEVLQIIDKYKAESEGV